MSSTILDQIIAHKREEVRGRIRNRSLAIVRALAEESERPRSFLASLCDPHKPRIIAECKKKSPSKGVLLEQYDPGSIATAYELGGAAAISVLTDEAYFGGKLEHLLEVKSKTSIPLLRKDFVIDEYQIFETLAAGGDSFLLLAGVLDTAQLQYFIEIGRDLGMEPLVETHSEADAQMALATDAKIIGINNRNLKTMQISLKTSLTLLAKIKGSDPAKRIFVCESGIHSASDVQIGLSAGFDAFLVGEHLMTADHPTQELLALRGQSC